MNSETIGYTAAFKLEIMVRDEYPNNPTNVDTDGFD